jgi:hypothetical protein
LTTTPLLDGIVTEHVAAAELKIHHLTLKRWADKPNGPPRIHLGRTPYYNLAELRRWVEAQQRVVEEPKPRRDR